MREYDEKQMRELSLVENIQRHDLNPLEEAKAIQELMKQFDYTQAQAAERLGRSRAAVANLLRMLNLPEELQAMVAEERVTAGQMRPLLALADREQQLKVGRALAEHGWSARTVEEVVKTVKEGKSFRSWMNVLLFWIKTANRSRIRLPKKKRRVKRKPPG